MSTLKADTIQSTGGGAATLTKQSAAKAWVSFDGTAASAAARASFGISSMDDNGTGDYDVNLSSAMSDANYAVVVGQGRYNEGSYGGQYEISVATVATTSLQVFSNTTSATRQDYSYNAISFLGDLA